MPETYPSPADDELAPDYEYEYARDVLTSVAKLCVEYPPIKDLPTNTSLEKYLKGVAKVIGNLVAFEHRGIGIGTVLDQITTQLSATSRLPNPGYRFAGIRNDCKLPAALTVAVVQELAHTHGWPLRAESLLMSANAHAFVSVFVDDKSEQIVNFPFDYDGNDYFVVDFESGGSLMAGVRPHSKEKYQELADRGYIKHEAELSAGLQMYDRQYLAARAQELENGKD